jgi:serine/threonine-protein kinase RsbT
MTPPLEKAILQSEQDVVSARQLVRRLTQQLEFSLVDQTKLVTATSELARNTVKYGRGGEMRCELLVDGLRKGIRLQFVDEGPGIADVDQALKDGFTTGGGLGMGLAGAKRLVEEFAIETAPGKGTRVTIARWK